MQRTLANSHSSALGLDLSCPEGHPLYHLQRQRDITHHLSHSSQTVGCRCNAASLFLSGGYEITDSIEGMHLLRWRLMKRISPTGEQNITWKKKWRFFTLITRWSKLRLLAYFKSPSLLKCCKLIIHITVCQSYWLTGWSSYTVDTDTDADMHNAWVTLECECAMFAVFYGTWHR